MDLVPKKLPARRLQLRPAFWADLLRFRQVHDLLRHGDAPEQFFLSRPGPARPGRGGGFFLRIRFRRSLLRRFALHLVEQAELAFDGKGMLFARRPEQLFLEGVQLLLHDLHLLLFCIQFLAEGFNGEAQLPNRVQEFPHL